MGLTASLKQELALSSDVNEAHRLRFLLGMAYYFKAMAEEVFVKARKQGIQLEDDFDASEAQTYNAEYLEGKMRRSAGKSRKLLKKYKGMELLRDIQG